MIIQTVKLKTELSEDELLEIARERLPQFLAVPGLVQKYYFRGEGPGEFGGVYMWNSRESMEAYRASELCATIGAAYRTIEPPVIEVAEVLFPLRD